MKWVEIALKPCPERYKLLSETIAQELSQPNEVAFIESNLDDFAKKLTEAQAQADAIRVGAPFLPLVPNTMKQNSKWITTVKAADFIHKISGQWWADNLTCEGIQRALTAHPAAVDLNQSALVVGTGGEARTAIAALLHVGFNKVSVADLSIEAGTALVAEFQKTYFSARFEFIPKDKLVLLPACFSVVVNTTPLEATNEVLRELYYFNFLKLNGLVCDLSCIPCETPLLIEAKEFGVTIVPGFEVAAHADSLFAETVFGKPLDVKKYATALKGVLEKIPFSIEPFMQEIRNS